MRRWTRGVLVLALTAVVAGCAQREPAAADTAHTAAVPPPANSPLAKVQVGMSEQEVEKLLGPPTSQNEYVTGKAFIPFYYGEDRWRRSFFYQGLGRIVFAGSGGFSRDVRVERVEYDPNEPGRAR